MVTKLKPELDFSLHAIIAVYTWIGDKIPDIKDLANIELESKCVVYNLSEWLKL